MRRARKDFERFKKCPKCGGVNTSENGFSDDEFHLWFFGWCFSCDHGYQYDMRVETVRDRKGRL